MSLLSASADTFYAFRFLRLLTTKWEDTGAFKAGILDKNGNVLRKTVGSDRAVYNYFHRLVFNIKRLLNKIPFGKSTLASYLTALYLIKEETRLSDEEILEILSEVTGETDLSFAINEDAESQILSEGMYQLKHDLPLPKTGAMLALKGSDIIAESNFSRVGEIFGVPVFSVWYPAAQSNILITKEDIIE